MSLDLPDAWVKAAVEHVVVQILYRTPEGEIVTLELEPDAIAFSGGEAVGFLGYTPRDHALLQCCRPAKILGFAATDRRFSPPPRGRWRELVPRYERRGLAGREW